MQKQLDITQKQLEPYYLTEVLRQELYNSYNFKLFRDLVQGSANIFLA